MDLSQIIIATSHTRNDHIEVDLRHLLPDCRVIRIQHPDQLTLEHLEEMSPEWIFFPHWSWIIPELVFKKYRCVIFHMTDLPYGRGGSPLQNLIVRGHSETVLTALSCGKEIDAGAIYLKKTMSLKGTAEEILERASKMMPEMIAQIVTKNIQPVNQEGEVTLFKRRKPEDSNIGNLETLDQIYDYIRMLDAEGYPNAFLEFGNFKIEFSKANFSENNIEARVKIKKNYEKCFGHSSPSR